MENKSTEYTWVGSSERLLYRHLHPNDAEQMYLLNSDPRVMKYTGDDPFTSVESAKEFLEAYDPYSITGFGRWCVISKDTGAILGWCGLKRLPSGEVDLGYRFFKKYWLRGYATESSRFSIKLAQKRYGLTALIGRVVPENTGSVNVLKKVGMQFSHMTKDCGEDTAIYKLSLEQ
jgi:RimJ/RimL family protein N-acetyltransferase